MKKVARLFLVLILLLATGFVRVSAEETLPPRLQKLADEAYHYYSSRGTDNFFEAVQKVKDATEFSEYQETYYRACAYEAIYMFEYVDRQKGVALSHAIYHHAKEDKSNVGMYFATFTLGTIREQSGNYGLAEKSFLQALELKKKYLPDESAAPCYLGLCEVALHRKDYEAVKEYARLALDEPKAIPMNQITAWSYKCLARYNEGDSLGFEEAYKERAQLTPGTIATRLNHALAEDNEQGMFVTMFIGLINLKTGHMEYCNAGHNPPLLDGEYMKMESNAPIGLWSEVEFEGEEVDDMHGKTLFVYTDGISEAENVNKEQFGDERLQTLLKQDLGDARQTSETIHKAVADFVGDAEPSDDLTKMCIIMK